MAGGIASRGRMVTGAVVAAALVLALWALPARAATGWRITQREGTNRSQLVLAASGLRFDALAPAKAKGKPKPQVGVIVRYRDRRLFLLDPANRRYDALSLAGAVASYAAELKLANKGQPSERLPGRPGAKRRKGQASLKRPAARLRALGLTTRIGPLLARAYLLTAGKARQRIWYADALPVPPSAVRALFAKGSGGQLNAALSGRAGRVPLRIDEPHGRRWSTVLRTTSIRRGAVAARLLRPPAGYTERNLLASAASPPARSADVPADALRCAFVINCLGVLRGPVSEHPDIYAFYWGSHYHDRLDFVSAVNRGLHNFVGDEFADPNSQAFWGPLAQYGVHQGRLLGYQVDNDNPDDSVGSWNFFDIDWFVTTHRFGDAPTYWWRWSDHDPIFAIFVDQSEVDSSGWAGYHFYTPTEGLLFAFLAHPSMPWFIVKTPAMTSLPADRNDPNFKKAVDQTTERASHEFVEAATDPYPFQSWGDPAKEPIWEKGELADICSEGNTAPWVEHARVLKGSTAFSTYWSNDDDACVPESRPSVTIASPADGTTYTWGAQVTFLASGDDLFDGGLDPTHNYLWTDDRDGQIGVGKILNTTALSPGTHHVTVTVRNSEGAARTAGPVTVTMEVKPPAVRIDEPADGSTFGTDQKVNLRGSVFDPKDGDASDQGVWSVDGTPIGTGAKLLTTQITQQGAHIVTLSYTNSAGLKGTDGIKINIGPPSGNPSVTITDPPLPDGYVDRYVTPGVPFKLAATATPQGAATIPDSGYAWTSDIDGPLGTGQSITATLSAGTHIVTVTVTDSLGHVGTDKVTIISQPVIG